MLNDADWASIHSIPQTPELFDVKGFSGGIRLSVDFGEYFGLNSGMRYSWGRQDYLEPQINATNNEMFSSQHYLQLPILFSLGTSNQYDSRFYMSMGLTLGYLLNYREHRSHNNGNDNFQFWNYEGTTYSQTDIRTTDYAVISYKTDPMYKTFMMNALAEIGFKKDI